MIEFKLYKDKKTELANEVIDRFLPKKEGYLGELYDAMKYSVNAGGKRLRPILIDTAYKMMGGKGEVAFPLMAAMEYLHTYSLVHDDMPEIDNDEYRRGAMTTHKKYGQACALLAGDGLLHYSWQVALETFKLADTYNIDKANVINALKIFADKSGTDGMLGGQSVDVLFTGKSPDKDRLDYIYRLKTCALIEGSIMIGAALAGASDNVLSQLENVGRNIGLAFQIKDDILDYIGDAAILGKPVGSDMKNEKTTYVTLEGLDRAQNEVKELSDEADRLLTGINCVDEDEKEFLLLLIDSLVNRNY